MENQLQKLIISAQLTPKEKEVADYVLENLHKCCFMTSTELAGVLNVSYSSVIRLTKTLGFTGYPDFQNFLRESYCGTVQGCGCRILIPAERIEAIKKKEHKATVQDTVCAYTLSNIQSTIAGNTEEQYRKATSNPHQQRCEIYFFLKRINLCGRISEYDPQTDTSSCI